MRKTENSLEKRKGLEKESLQEKKLMKPFEGGKPTTFQSVTL